MESDIRWDYGKVIEKKNNKIVAPSLEPEWKKIEDDFYGL